MVGGERLRENRTEAQVLELIYHGDHIRCRLAVHGNDDFIVKMPNSRLDRALTVGAGHDGRLDGPRTAARSTPPDETGARPGPGPAPNRRQPA